MSLFAHAIPQVEAPLVGIHVLWNGPNAWVYSPKGWSIQRRFAIGRAELDCMSLAAADLSKLRARHVLPIRFGELRDRSGVYPETLAIPGAGGGAPGTACEVVTLELAAPQTMVRVTCDSKQSFAVGLRQGKVVAGGRSLGGAGSHDLVGQGIDTVVLYTVAMASLGYCLDVRSATGWSGVPVVRELQLPLRELMPSLGSAADEYTEARSRLLPTESLDEEEFTHLADLLRRMVERTGPPRPIDLAMLLRDDTEHDFDELMALDPLRGVLPHPRWRRALGFAWFDADPTLIPGVAYDYRVTAGFPADDLDDRVLGFHTVPAGTSLPADVCLGDVRIRFPEPRQVTLAGSPAASDLSFVTRRGVELSPDRRPFFLMPELEGWSAVIDLPAPAERIELELAGGHDLVFSTGDPWLPWTTTVDPVPPGERPRLELGGLRHQVRLRGTGFLCGLRLLPSPPPTSAIRDVSIVLPPVTLADWPLPPEPLDARIANLQVPRTAATTDVPDGPVASRQDLGFRVTWLPTPLGGITTWPPDLGAPPLAEAALFQVEHQEVGAATWEPLLDDENFMTGHRDDVPPQVELSPGGDVLAIFPEARQPSSGWPATLSWSDVFDFPEGSEPGTPLRRPVPAPGTDHQYRVRAVDAIGRPGATWRVTNQQRLEKWASPPVPVAPTTTTAEELSGPAPTGVHARVLVKGATDLTAEELAILGTHANVVILRWGWHASQREQDPFATEFRVYRTRQRLDAIAGDLTGVVPLGNGSYQVSLALERPIAANAARGRMVDAGYPFELTTHGAGTTITGTLLARVPLPGGGFAVPRTGPVLLPVRLTPDRTRPPAWGARVEIVPITAATSYASLPMFDVLDLSAAHPTDAVFVGVSTADAQPYVPDQLPAPGRPGNESAIVPVLAEGRYLLRPAAVDVPSLAAVPVIVAPEPRSRSLDARLDLTPFLTGTGVSAGEQVRLERVSDADIYRAYRADGTRLLARVLEPRRPGDAEVEVTVASPADRATILGALNGTDVRALKDQHLVFLAASHHQGARLYTPAISEPVSLPVVDASFPGSGARWVHRVRRADAAGNLSEGGITLRGVVRVPVTGAVAPPALDERQAADPRNRLRLRVDGTAEVTHLLTFRQVVPASGQAPGGAELLRVPSAPGLYPSQGIRVRLSDGTLLPTVVTALTGEPPRRSMVVDVPAAAGERLRVWAVAASRDGVVSPLAGPFPVAMPPPPLAAPTLTLFSATIPDPEDPEALTVLTFKWTWPSPADASEVFLERSADGSRYERVSPRLGLEVATVKHTKPPGAWRFRLVARRLDGRTAFSNVLTL